MTAQIIPHPAAVPLIDMARAMAEDDEAWRDELIADTTRFIIATANRPRPYERRFLRWAGYTLIVLGLIAGASVALSNPLAKARHDAAVHYLIAN